MHSIWKDTQIHTGLSELDDQIGGLIPGQLIVIASRPGMGKTALALNVAVNAAKRSKKIAFFSLELGRSEVMQRILSYEIGVDFSRIHKGELNGEERRQIADARASIDTSGIITVDDPGFTVADMNAQCHSIDDLGLVVIDYLQLLYMKRFDQTCFREVSEITLSMKNMAKELNLPVICLSQLTRQLERRENKRPILGDLRGDSGALAQDADVIIGLYRESYYHDECEDPFSAEAIVLKNRNGDAGTVRLRFFPEHMAFVSAEQQKE